MLLRSGELKEKGADMPCSTSALWLLETIRTSPSGAGAAAPPPAQQADAPASRSLLLLDLDNTLVHTFVGDRPAGDVLACGRPRTWCVKRPHLARFLHEASQRFELGVFTASPKSVATEKLDWLDTERVLQRRWFRCSCVEEHGLYLKDLRVVSADVSRVLLLEDLPFIGARQPDHVIPIRPWSGDSGDTALTDLLPSLIRLARCPQPTKALRGMLGLAARARDVVRHSPPDGPCVDGRGATCVCSCPHEHELLQSFLHRERLSPANKRPPRLLACTERISPALSPAEPFPPGNEENGDASNVDPGGMTEAEGIQSLLDSALPGYDDFPYSVDEVFGEALEELAGPDPLGGR